MKTMIVLLTVLFSSASFSSSNRLSCFDGENWKEVITVSKLRQYPSRAIQAQVEVAAFRVAENTAAQYPGFSPKAPYVLDCSDRRITLNSNNILEIKFEDVVGPVVEWRIYNCNGTYFAFGYGVYGWSNSTDSGSGVLVGMTGYNLEAMIAAACPSVSASSLIQLK